MSSTNLNPIQLAIVSPCSRCQNQLSTPQAGFPPCPRRQIQKYKTDLDQQGLPTQHLAHLVLTGQEAARTADSPEAGNDLRNPVYWNEGEAVLVWVATLADNGGVLKSDGTVTPHLLDPDFDTAYIQCHSVPVVPASSATAYFTTGAFNEGDQLEVRFSANQQVGDGENDLLIDGFAQKVHFAHFVPRQAVDKDLVPAGI